MKVSMTLGAAILFAASFFASTEISLAQATRTWVSGVGDDANPCSRTAPCKTFAGAISKTAAGGEINCLDPAGFGGVTITKAITLLCDHTEGGVLVSGTNGIVVNAGINDDIILSGLDIDGLGSGLSGIVFLAGESLVVRNTHIRRFNGTNSGFGIRFQPNGTAKLTVIDTLINQNGSTGSTGAGVLIQPIGSGSATASFSNVHFFNNRAGIRADGTGSTGGILVSLAGGSVVGSTFGGVNAVAAAADAATAVIVRGTSVVGNSVGILANGQRATFRIGTSTVTGNSIAATISGGATMSSFGDNQIENNASAGSAIPVIPHK